MFGWILLAIILILAAFWLGHRLGRRKNPVVDHKLDSLQQAWQRGYDDAAAYLRAASAPAAAQPGASRPAPPEAPEQAQPSPNSFAAGQPYLQRADSEPALAGPAAQIAPAKPAKVLTKRERELRNINITLYVAALMIVSAGALFLSFALPLLPKLIGFYLLAAVFYAAGLITCAAKPSLRPAGTAFAGTGLALLPLCAIATRNSLDVSGATVWLIFSLIGTLAVGYATLRLESRVLAWLAVLVLVSTAMAGAAAMQRGVLYYLLVLLVLSVLLMLLAARSQRVRDSIFCNALLSTAQLLPAFVFGLCLILFGSLSSRDFLWIFALLAAQLLLSMRLLENLRRLRFYGARASFTLMLLAACNYLDFSQSAAALVLAYSFALQAVAVLIFASGYRRRLGLAAEQLRAERAVLWGLGLAAASAGFWAAPDQGSSQWPSYLWMPLLLVSAVPGLHRRSKLEVLVVVLLALLVLPDAGTHAWRPLPMVILAILALSYAHRQATGHWREVCGHLRWAVAVLGGAVAALSLHEILAGAKGSSTGMALCVGMLVVLAVYWAQNLAKGNLLDPRPALFHRLARLGASALAATVLLFAISGLGALEANAIEFLGIAGRIWFTGGLATSVGLAIASGLRVQAVTVRHPQLEHRVNIVTVFLLGAMYALSFEEGLWLLAPAIGTAILGYFMASLRQSNDAQWKIAYAALAQLVFSSMIWWIAGIQEADVHGRFALLLVSVAVPQLARLAATAIRGKQLRRELRWIALGVLAGIPAAILGYASVAGGADRGVVLLAAVFLGLHGATAFKADARSAVLGRQLYLLAPVLAAIALSIVPAAQLRTDTGWIRESWWSPQVACVMLLALGGAAVLAEARWGGNPRYSVALGVAMFLPAAAAAFQQAGTWWEVAAQLLAATALALLVHTRGSAWFAAGSSILLGYAAVRAVWEVREAAGSYRLESMDAVWALLGAATVFYLLAIFHGRLREPEPGYPLPQYRHADAAGGASRLYFCSMLLALLLAGGIAHLDTGWDWSIIGGAVLIFGVAVLVRRYELPAGAAAYAVDGYLVLVSLLVLGGYARIMRVPESSSVAAYFCLVAAALVIWRNIRVDRRLERGYLLAGAIAGSLALIASLLQSNAAAQLTALLFFAALVAWNLKLGDRLLIWWGAVAITLAVLWFLRDLAFLWLVLIGAALIAAAIYKLMKVDKQAAAAEPQQPEGQVGAPGSEQSARPDRQQP